MFRARALSLAGTLLLAAAATPTAASANHPGSVHKQITKLSKQVKKLRKEVRSLQATAVTPGPVGATGPQGPVGPTTGPAGGALAGSYPDPTIATGAITSAEVFDNSLTLADLLGVNYDGTVSLSGIPNGRCTQVVFSVSGAQVGQTAIVTIGAPIQNGILMLAQRVTSEDHVEVNACNFSGGAMTAISDFPIRVTTFG